MCCRCFACFDFVKFDDAAVDVECRARRVVALALALVVVELRHRPEWHRRCDVIHRPWRSVVEFVRALVELSAVFLLSNSVEWRRSALRAASLVVSRASSRFVFLISMSHFVVVVLRSCSDPSSTSVRLPTGSERWRVVVVDAVRHGQLVFECIGPR